jgi:hypothetical protein
MDKLKKISNTMLKENAAKLYDTSPNKIIKVIEGYNGASIVFKNGNNLVCPREVWYGF